MKLMIILDSIDEVVKLLKNGEVVALPTDGIFGLFCLQNNTSGINKIYELKNREISKNLCVYEKYPPIDVNLPVIGMTYIKNGIGYRSSRIHTEIDKIIEKTGPLVGTSCNLSNTIPVTHIKHIPFKDIHVLNKICINGLESTILNLDTNKIIRSGYIRTETFVVPDSYYIKISSDLYYNYGYDCEDLARYFWYFVNEFQSVNFEIFCKCYRCQLIQKYIDVINSKNKYIGSGGSKNKTK